MHGIVPLKTSLHGMIFVTICTFLLTGGPLIGGSAMDLYVHPDSGKDDNPGTKDKPFQTVGAAVEHVPLIVASQVSIHLAAGEYKKKGGQGDPSGALVLERQMRRDGERGAEVGIRLLGEDSRFERQAKPGEVILDFSGSPLVQVFGGVWHLENLQIGNRTSKSSQEGIEVIGTASLVHLKDLRIRTRSQSGAGMRAFRGGEIDLYGSIELNEDLHDKAPEASFCRMEAGQNGTIRCRDPKGSLSVGNGSLSTGYYGVIELGCKTAAITSWTSANCLAINNSGRIDLHGTETTLCSKIPNGTVIGPEDDGHILAEGARIILKTQPGSISRVTLQKASMLMGGTFVVEGPSAAGFSTMSGSRLICAARGKVADVGADTGSYILLDCNEKPEKVNQMRGGQVIIQEEMNPER